MMDITDRINEYYDARIEYELTGKKPALFIEESKPLYRYCQDIDLFVTYSYKVFNGVETRFIGVRTK